jgi:MFS superfamily sulfate permease-like transporter
MELILGIIIGMIISCMVFMFGIEHSHRKPVDKIEVLGDSPVDTNHEIQTTADREESYVV